MGQGVDLKKCFSLTPLPGPGVMRAAGSGGWLVAGVKGFLNRFTAKCGATFKLIVEGDVKVAARFLARSVCVLL